MKYRLTPQLIALSYEAALKSFWRKNALKKFLRGCNLSAAHLNTWDQDETKRSFLDRTFDLLQRNEKGKRFIIRMAIALSEQTAFPDLRNWEDSEDKINEAKRAVKDLREYLEDQNRQIDAEEKKEAARKAAFEQNQTIRRQITDKSALQSKLDNLYSKVGTQEGGYEFQEWFYDLLDYCEIDNKRPYVVEGRQIDGSLTREGTTYLIELKFTKSRCAAGDVDSIKAKIDKMADNTMGIMVSISGFSSVAISDASGSKTTLLLMDSSHLYYYLTGSMEFRDLISRVRRNASQTGESFLSVDRFGV